MKKINYIFIGILCINGLHCMKRQFLPENLLTEICEDLEDGVNPDSENSVPYNFLFNVNDNAKSRESLQVESTHLSCVNDNYKAFVVVEESSIQELPIVTAPTLSSEESSTKNNAEKEAVLCPQNNYKACVYKIEGSEKEYCLVTALPFLSDEYDSAENNKILEPDVKIKEKVNPSSLNNIMKMRGMFSLDENITFAANYFNRLFGKDNLIKEIYHSVPPQLIALMMRYAEKRPYNTDKGERVLRRVAGILCMPSSKRSNLNYEIKNVQIISHRDDVIFHLSFEVPYKKISWKVSYFHEYMSNNSDYIKRIVQENLIHCSRQIITSKDAIKKASISLKQNQKSPIAMPVKKLSALGDFPNIIIKGNELCPKSKDDLLYFPLSYKEPIAFITTVDWMQESV